MIPAREKIVLYGMLALLLFECVPLLLEFPDYTPFLARSVYVVAQVSVH